MKNYLAKGDTIEFTAAADVTSGEGVLLGSLFGVATGDVANGERGTMKLTGIFDLPKAASQSWSPGDLIYWDAGNSVCTKTASTHKRIGAAVTSVAGGANDIIGRVRLNGAAVN